MSVNEVYLGLSFIYGLLKLDATLQGYAPGGGWQAMAPPTIPEPFWIVALQSPGNDTLTQNAVRLLSTPLFQVKMVGPTALIATLASGAERIDTLLGGKEGLRNQTITGGFIAACYRDSPLQSNELVNGELFSSIGGLYRMEIQQTT